ncbi:MAG: carboxypeptidase-like regulatory domain-containing protein [Bacteroidales bacterium]
MTRIRPRLNIKAGLLLIILVYTGRGFSQSFQGKVLSSDTKSAIGFVNIGIIGKNVGTVSDKFGDFTIELDNVYNNDSIRFSMIGYESKSFKVEYFKENSIKTIYLDPKSYFLTEVKIFFHKTREVTLGTQVVSDALKSGFENNNLGSELGIKLDTKGEVKLEDINLNVATCTYDSVTYRLNIYKTIDNVQYKNILTEPIYISFSKDKINKVITFDLRKYSIIIEGDVLITLELYKDLGEGRLLFYTQFFTGYTYHKKTSEGRWTKAPGLIGMYLHGQLIKEARLRTKKF